MNSKGYILVLAILATASASVVAPLLTYSMSLAIFGLPHVLTELRYVDERFGARLSPRLGFAFLGLLALIVLLRLFSLGDYGSAEAPRIELFLVLSLAAVTLPTLRKTPKNFTIGLILMGVIACGLMLAPLATLVLLAVGHNLTPIGFILEQCHPNRRKRILALCFLVFGLVPILIATGFPGQVFSAMGLTLSNATILGTGPLSSQLGVFVPNMWHDSRMATQLFSAAAYLQCVHYAVVIHLLPRLAKDPASSYFAWPSARVFAGLIVGAGLVFFIGFSFSFTEARSVYGIFAAVHAWIEVPILLLALELRAEKSILVLGASQHAA